MDFDSDNSDDSESAAPEDKMAKIATLVDSIQTQLDELRAMMPEGNDADDATEPMEVEESETEEASPSPADPSMAKSLLMKAMQSQK